jgi:phosphoenolpyruvate carboxykinase (GTP)
VPAPGALDLGGLDLPAPRLREALRCDAGEWGAALADLDEFYRQFGARLPREIDEKLTDTRRRFGI